MDNAQNGANATLNGVLRGFDLSGATFPRIIVEKMLETNERFSKQSARDKEREEIVCRLLASGMSVEEISLITKIRADEIRVIESNNAKNTIPEYTRTYNSRVKSKKKAKIQQP